MPAVAANLLETNFKGWTLLSEGIDGGLSPQARRSLRSNYVGSSVTSYVQATTRQSTDHPSLNRAGDTYCWGIAADPNGSDPMQAISFARSTAAAEPLKEPPYYGPGT